MAGGGPRARVRDRDHRGEVRQALPGGSGQDPDPRAPPHPPRVQGGVPASQGLRQRRDGGYLVQAVHREEGRLNRG